MYTKALFRQSLFFETVLGMNKITPTSSLSHKNKIFEKKFLFVM